MYGANFNGGEPSSWFDSDLTDAKFDHARLLNVDLRNTVGLSSASFDGARFDEDTRFPEDFDPKVRGMVGP